MISGEGGSAPYSHPHWWCLIFLPNFLPVSGHHILVLSRAPLTFLPPHLVLGWPGFRTNIVSEVTDECQKC